MLGTTRQTRRKLWVVIVAIGVAVSACSSGASGPTIPDAVDDVPKAWPKDAVAHMEQLAARLGALAPDACQDLTVMPPADFLGTLISMQTATVVPRTIGVCTIGDENVEVVIFRNAAERDRFIEERRARICELSRRKKIGVPGLRFVTGPDWSMQPDTDTVAYDVIDTIGGTYDLEACAGQQDQDWDRASVVRLRGLGERLNAAGYACDLTIEDKDLTNRTPHYLRIGLPGALASCEADFGRGAAPTFGLVGFSADTTPPEKFLPGEMATLCSGGADVRAVRGKGWAALVVGVPVAEKVVAAIGGELDPLTCEQATAIVNSSTTSTTTKPATP